MTTKAYLIAGLGYGDEGKGATVDFLVRRKNAGLVVRYNGGPQAGHNVMTSDGRHHTFSQFGSGTFVTGVRTHLSRFMLISPISMLEEEQHIHSIGISDAFKRLTIDAEAVIVTPFQRAINRIVQIAKGTNSSCGMGVGQARFDHITYGDQVLFAGDFENDYVLETKLKFMQEISRSSLARMNLISNKRINEEMKVVLEEDAIDWTLKLYNKWRKRVTVVDSLALSDLLDETECTVFEGAQGVLLDEKWGEEGFNTWTNTTFENAQTLLKECGYVGQVYKIGVTRAYLTRHGDGPLAFEDEKYLEHYPEIHNDSRGFQGKFRVACLDVEKFRYALKCCGGVDALAVNHLDRFISYPKDIFEVPILIHGFGPTAADRELDLEVETTLEKGKKNGGHNEVVRAVGSGEES